MHKLANTTNIFMRDLSRMHGVPRVIISDRDMKLTSNFWMALFKGLATSFNFSTMYHLGSNGYTEWVKQVIKYML